MGKNILICPLNWGLGHATRCVPIIKDLTNQGNKVIIAADEGPLAFLQKEFPDHEFIKFPGFSPKYSRSNTQVFRMMRAFPGALRDFRRDHKTVESIVKNYNIDTVISDNRFGCWSKQAHSVFMTHQLHIQVPKVWKWSTPIINLFNNSYIKKYDEVWVPDVEDEPSLGGKLSHPALNGVNTKYIGHLSRFSSDNQSFTEKTNKFLVILSGPEPQRTMFENIVLKQARETKDNILILRAKPDSSELLRDVPDNVSMFNHVDDDMFVKLVNSAEIIICRGGYSSLMDLKALGRTAFLVPTPGQTEQEYLARHLSKKQGWDWCRQGNFRLDKIKI
ncbi:MAG: hypothetical protein IKQ09_07550 [Bacteroidales bacterium]|nr:hypothetical protein [Bacteroidales bacterium]